ncbi:hypothetical protein HOP50_09g54090 [Chloropicon primus]|uniref:Calponin-homology (CH) domain-containing protein n=5 Tax=Chloropicon primus TaxID=1764295 RepID=A0A5B8MR55_9CHLO|nr:hypothetical protein A3770_09p53790 [Chloropicon primus]UPR02085.1 hypothetical protein HOP50_09g54090 [Chloropicon primus]|eukprot:QDZ22861.1 hypothetical protein A3770_09p53790 [Chloropicon primus]
MQVQVFPPEVTFRAVTPGIVHSTIIAIKNVDTRARIIKVSHPSSSVFKLNGYQTSLKLAPGLETALEVSFQADASDRDYEDELLVVTETETLSVPLKAFQPLPKLVVEDGPRVDLGVVVKGTPVSKELVVANVGESALTFNFRKDFNDQLDIEPKEGVLGTGSKMTLSVKYAAEQLGMFAAPLEIEYKRNGGSQDEEGEEEKSEAKGEDKDLSFTTKFQITASVVNHQIELLTTKRKPLPSPLDLGTKYYGEVVVMKCLLVNNGPNSVKFGSHVGTSTEVNTYINDQEQANDIMALGAKLKPQSIFALEPKRGTIPAYSKIDVKLTFHPQKSYDIKGFTATQTAVGNSLETFDFLSVIQFERLPSHTVSLPLLGKATTLAVDLLPSMLHFNPIAVHEHQDAMVQIKNSNELLPLDFKVRNTPNFKASPLRGLLQPGETMSLKVSFAPRTLGNHRERISIESVNHKGLVLSTQHLTLVGRANGIINKQPMVGGPDALPDDFRKKEQFVEQDGERNVVGTQELMTKSKKKDLGSKTPPANNLDVTVKREKYQYYKMFLKSERQKRTMKTKYNQGKRDDPVNMGIKQASGLKEPIIPLPVADEPLWLDERYTGTNATYVRPKNRKPLPEEQARALSMLLKDKPEKQTQLKECSRALPLSDFGKLAVGPRRLDFGTITAMSKEERYLIVTNDLNAHVQVTLLTHDIPNLSESQRQNQIIPPRTTAAFPITLHCTAAQSFKRSVSYLINNIHLFEFDVVAEVVPVSLNVSKDNLLFEMNQEHFGEKMEEVFTLSNPNNHFAEFSWECNNKNFSVTPMEGSIEKNSSTKVSVLWHPIMQSPKSNSLGIHQGELVLSVVGGTTLRKKVILEGRFPDSRIIIKDKMVDFGMVPIGVPQLRHLLLKNQGTSEGFFKIDWQSKLGETLEKDLKMQVIPERGHIPAGGSVDVEIWTSPQKPMKFQVGIPIVTSGSRPLTIPVTGESMIPELVLAQDEFDFKSIYIGGAGRLPMTICNQSIISASLIVDLVEYPEFSLEIDREDWSTDDYDECPLIVDEKQKSNPPGDKARGSRYKLTVKENHKLTFNFCFRPKNVNKHAFELPMEIAGMAVIPDHIKRVVVAEGLKPRLVLSEDVVDFKTRIVIRNNAIKIPYSLEFKLKNNDKNDVICKLGTPVGNISATSSPVFQFTPMESEIKSGEELLVRASFLPRENKQYRAILPIYLDGNEEKSYVDVEVFGEGKFPGLVFDRHEVVLPPVPIGFKSHATFNILNDGYDNLELRYHLPTDTERLPIKIDFPEGKMIGIAKGSLPVEVSLDSDVSMFMAFTGNIEFLDEDGQRYVIAISGTVDNSIITTYDFLKANESERALALTDNKGNSVEAEGVERCKYLVNLVENEYALPEQILMGSKITKPSAHISRFLGSITLKGVFGVDIVNDLISSKGRGIIDLIETLSGKQVPGKISKPSSNRKEQAQQYLSQYEKILTFLRSYGAALNFVKPEFLLDVEDYKRIISAREVSGKISKNIMKEWENIEKRFDAVSSYCWTALTFQVVKIFVVSRVSLKSLRSLPIASAIEMGKSYFTKSNVYSVSETILLKWMTAHFFQALPGVATCITNFDHDLRNGLAFYSLLVGYWPSLGGYSKSLKKNPRGDNQVRENAELVIRMLQSLQLPYVLQPEDILNPDPRDMLLYVVYLYQTLPQFIPVSTLEFSMLLGEEKIKSIELKNPSKKTIAYMARLEGDASFQITHSNIRLEPGETIQIPVKVTQSIAKPVFSNLILASRRDGNAYASTLVFTLKTSVRTRSPLKVIETKTLLYKNVIHDFEVENLFKSTCEFRITVLNQSTPRQQKFPEAFGCDKSSVSLRSGESARLSLHFLPFVLENHSCLVCFESEEYGEFVYEVRGEVGLPDPLNTVKLQAMSNESVVQDVAVTFNNPLMDNARRTYLEKHPLARQKEVAERIRKNFYLGDEMQKNVLKYHVQNSSHLISCPKTILLKQGVGRQSKAGLGGAKKAAPLYSMDQETPEKPAVKPKQPLSPSMKDSMEDGPKYNIIPLSFNPKSAGVYPARLIVSSYDVRVYDIEFQVTAEIKSAEIMFDSQARKAVTQGIPIVNSGEKPMAVKGIVTGDSFSGPMEIIVPSNQTGNYPLTFNPAWLGRYEGSIELTIPSTEEKSVYKLVGNADEPLAEKHLVIEAQVRKKEETIITVPNVYGTKQEAQYTVYSDLQEICGEPSLTLRSGNKGEYKITTCSSKSGTLNGSITFTTSKGFYVWYTIELRVKSPEEAGRLQVSTQARSAVRIQLSLANPIEEDLIFSVHHSGQGLHGPEELILPGGGKAKYEMAYHPLVVGNYEGSVTFVNDLVGELWYKLLLSSLAPEPKAMPEFQCELGQHQSKELTITNPSSDYLVFQLFSDNPRNFTFSPKTVSLEPDSEARVVVNYVPSSLSHAESGKITAKCVTMDLAPIEYTCTGRGLAPHAETVVTVASGIGQSSSGMVMWQNPFPFQVTIDILSDIGMMSTDDDGGHHQGPFSLLIKKMKGITVNPSGALQVPFSFAPNALKAYNGDIGVLYYNREEDVKVVWKYRIEGIAESFLANMSTKLTCKARKMLTEVIHVDVSGKDTEFKVDDYYGKDEEFEVEIVPSARVDLEAIAKFLRVRTVTGIISDASCALEVTYAPQRTMSMSVDIVIVKKNGGRWRFELLLEATSPEIDGKIFLEANVGDVAHRSLTLPASMSGSPFSVYFYEPPTVFDVKTTGSPASPEIGISFTPKEFGREYVAVLIVETEESQWIHEVHGTYPPYVPPDKSQMKGKVAEELKKVLSPARKSSSSSPRRERKALTPRGGSRK